MMPDPSEQTTERVTLYRCEACGKWSHARRRPKHHRVYTKDPADDAVILDELEGYEVDTGAYDPGFYVACGPFATWEARPA